MSREMALAFINKVNRDIVLQSQLKNIDGHVDDLVKIATRNGYQFTTDEWITTITDNISSLYTGALSEAALKHVTGGAMLVGIERGQPAWINKFTEAPANLNFARAGDSPK